jgi:hypothetical protein
VASKLAEATSADELMAFHKWMPAGQDTAQALLNADKLSCSWGLHTALWRLLHPLTYNNKEQRAVFAANAGYIRVAAAALSLPNSGALLLSSSFLSPLFFPSSIFVEGTGGGGGGALGAEPQGWLAALGAASGTACWRWSW